MTRGYKTYEEYQGKEKDTNALALPSGEELQIWDKQPGEDALWYERFLGYMTLGPNRSVDKAARQYYLLEQRILPGQPVPSYELHLWYHESHDRKWLKRARSWDILNLQELSVAIERERRQRIQEQSVAAIEGWQLFQTMAINSIYQRDDDGQLILDADGQPILKLIDNPVDAVKVFGKAITGIRVENGLPTEYFAAPEKDLEQQMLATQDRIAQLESENAIDAEFREIEDD